jgi:protoporphyrinogen oxidase
VGLLLKRLRLGGDIDGGQLPAIVPDNWIYVQEPRVQIGRIQIFNNWSPYMVADPRTIWMGLEYFVNEGDSIWSMRDADVIQFAVGEMRELGVIDPGAILDHIVIRMPKTYPAYFGTYNRFGEIREYLKRLKNLYPLGRNGMHRYNNQDHSMLSAMMAVEGVVSGAEVRDELWTVNTEQRYHERK